MLLHIYASAVMKMMDILSETISSYRYYPSKFRFRKKESNKNSFGYTKRRRILGEKVDARIDNKRYILE